MRFLLSGSASERQNPENFERPQSRLFEIVLCAAVKAHPNLDFRWYRESPHPGAGLLFRKEAKARAVLGLAEPVHPLPHLPRQSRLFGRRFRLHPPGGGRGILFEYRAADWNPALALRMRAIGAAPRCAMMRCGRQMRWLEGVWWRKAPASEHGRALCGGDSGGRGGASAGEGRWLEKGFWGCEA